MAGGPGLFFSHRRRNWAYRAVDETLGDPSVELEQVHSGVTVATTSPVSSSARIVFFGGIDGTR